MLALVVAGTAGWFRADRAQQRADHLRQLDRSCAGLLPGERLRGFVPADGAGHRFGGAAGARWAEGAPEGRARTGAEVSSRGV
ncbi:hypothetical protein [Streptomyces sp. EN23]|uniref:hypothetical protein n=1 Tax=Streptomyces sp. EN23 TaxID=212774 RepID=UPI0008515E92|nr:hypothetical protein [Streptomyces sp. EN23]